MTRRRVKDTVKDTPAVLKDKGLFEQTDEERMFSRAHLRTQKALLGEIGPRSAYACVFGAALLCVEAGVEASKAYDAFKAEYERVQKEWDNWKLDVPERLKAEVKL